MEIFKAMLIFVASFEMIVMLNFFVTALCRAIIKQNFQENYTMNAIILCLCISLLYYFR